jgi:hypothetical protein
MLLNYIQNKNGLANCNEFFNKGEKRRYISGLYSNQKVKWKFNIKHMAMLDRYLTLSCQSFVPLRRLIFILFVKKCDLWPETARKPVNVAFTIVIFIVKQTCGEHVIINFQTFIVQKQKLNDDLSLCNIF